MSKPSIFIVRTMGPAPRDCAAYALAEDGVILAHHISSSQHWARLDMGLNPISPTGKLNQRGHYVEHYPDGYTLVDLTDFTALQLESEGPASVNVVGYQQAVARYLERQQLAAAQARENATARIADLVGQGKAAL